MTPSFTPTLCGITAALHHGNEPIPAEVLSLREHFDLCNNAHGQHLRWQCLAEGLKGFVAARFITTLSLVTLVVSITASVV